MVIIRIIYCNKFSGKCWASFVQKNSGSNLCDLFFHTEYGYYRYVKFLIHENLWAEYQGARSFCVL